jgi:hypothetical protein
LIHHRMAALMATFTEADIAEMQAQMEYLEAQILNLIAPLKAESDRLFGLIVQHQLDQYRDAIGLREGDVVQKTPAFEAFLKLKGYPDIYGRLLKVDRMYVPEIKRRVIALTDGGYGIGEVPVIMVQDMRRVYLAQEGSAS